MVRVQKHTSMGCAIVSMMDARVRQAASVVSTAFFLCCGNS